MQIFGIDYSYTNPAICVLGQDFQTSIFYFASVHKKFCIKKLNYEGIYLKEDQWSNNLDRYIFLAQWAIDKIKQHWTDDAKIILEGYAYGAKNSLMYNIAENIGILKYMIKHELNVYPVIMAPPMVKQKWASRGNANKEMMAQALFEKEHIDILKWFDMKHLMSPAHDVVDSYAIAKSYLALEHS